MNSKHRRLSLSVSSAGLRQQYSLSCKGMALIGTVLLMIVLVLLGQAMIFLTRYESKSEVETRLKDSALYIADAGVEKAIYRLKNDITGDFTETVGAGTGSSAGQAAVTIEGQGGNIYKITSIGYVPFESDYKARRKIEVLAEISPEQPDEAIRCGGNLKIQSGTNIYGTVKANGQIRLPSNVHFYPDSNGTCSVFTNSGIAQAVSITGKVEWHASGQYIKCRGPANDPITGDAADTGVYDESNLEGEIPAVVEEDTSSDTDPIENFPYYDEDALLDGSQVVHETREIYDNSNPYDFNGQVHEYREGLEIRSNADSVGNSSGTLIVTGGSDSYDYGMDINSNFGKSDNYAHVNLIVTPESGPWEEDIRFNSNAYIEGYVFGSSTVTIVSNVHIKGVVEGSSTINLRSNVTLEYGEFGYELPGKGGGGIRIISWEEVK